jgi:methionyl-tRNA formyltransferase
MRVVFFGTPEFAVPSLSALLAANVDIAAVVTQPDRPTGRSRSRLTAPPVKRLAQAAGLPVWQPEQPRGEVFYRQFRDLHADLGVVVAYGHLLKPELLAIPRFGLVNVHASLLPRWRGAAPIQWALLAGDTETGVTIMRVEAGLDSGAVWHECRTAIADDDTAGTLTDRLAHLGATTLVDVLPRVALGEPPVPQRAEGMTHAPKIHRDLARVRWDQQPGAVSCRIRAMDPAPGAWTTIDGAEIKMFGAGIVRAEAWAQHAAPGTIIGIDERLIIATGDDGAVQIAEIQPAGRRRLAAAEWVRGAHLAADARLE